MGSIQYKILIIIMFFSCQFIYSNDIKDYEGIWMCKHSNNSEENSFIVIKKLNDKKYFVLFTNPYWKYQLDYSEYGYLDKNGYITVKSKESIFYLELDEQGYLYHYWNSLNDSFPSKYEKIDDEETMRERDKTPELTPQDIYDFIKSQGMYRERKGD